MIFGDRCQPMMIQFFVKSTIEYHWVPDGKQLNGKVSTAGIGIFWDLKSGKILGNISCFQPNFRYNLMVMIAIRYTMPNRLNGKIGIRYQMHGYPMPILPLAHIPYVPYRHCVPSKMFQSPNNPGLCWTLYTYTTCFFYSSLKHHDFSDDIGFQTNLWFLLKAKTIINVMYLLNDKVDNLNKNIFNTFYFSLFVLIENFFFKHRIQDRLVI